MYEEYIKQFIAKRQERDFSGFEVLTRRLDSVSKILYSELSLFVSEWCAVTGEHPECWAIQRIPGLPSVPGGLREGLHLIYESFKPEEMLQFKIQVIPGSVVIYFPGESVASFGESEGFQLSVKVASSVRQWFRNNLYSGKLLDSMMLLDWRPTVEHVK